jgi:hypothetical protein
MVKTAARQGVVPSLQMGEISQLRVATSFTSSHIEVTKKNVEVGAEVDTGVSAIR